MSYYNQIIGFGNYESKWYWDFMLSNGSRTQAQTTSMYKSFKEYMIDPNRKIKLVRMLYCKTKSYPSVLVGIELVDSKGIMLQTKLMSELSTNESDFVVVEFELAEYERLIGVKSSRRGTLYHYDF